MKSEWLNNSAIVNFIMIILTFVTLVFTITGSDKNIAFVKKTFLLLGRLVLGIIIMGVRVLLASLVIGFVQNKIDPTLTWQEYFYSMLILKALIIFPGILTATIASSGANWPEVVKRAALSAMVTVLIVDVLTSNINFSFLWLSVETLTSLLAGLTIAFLLRASNLWVYSGGFAIGYKRK